MKDLLGNELSVGDAVVFGGGQHKTLYTGLIAKINPKTVSIGEHKLRHWNKTPVRILRKPEEVVKC